MRLAAAAIVAALLLLAAVGTGALRARERATNAVGQQAEPLLVGAQVMYFSLADADATATNTFLKSGLEPPARRQAYLDDLTRATKQLAAVARQAGSSTDAATALDTINTELPTYTGLVESARSNNRLGLPVGAAYLREGSTLMRKQILPAVGQLYKVEAARLDRAYASGRSLRDVFGVLEMAVLALVVLISGQVFLTRRTNRVFNPALLAATLVAVILLGWALLSFSASASRLQAARTKGSDPVQLLSTARILISRAQADENLFLVSRGGGGDDLADFDAVSEELKPADGSRGLLAKASAGAPTLPALYDDYLTAHKAVIAAATTGQFAKAVDLATGTDDGDVLPAASQLSTVVGTHIDQAQKAFEAKAGAARHDLAFLGFAMIALVAVAAALAVVGFEQRINEYR